MDLSPESRTVLSVLNNCSYQQAGLSFEAIRTHDSWTQLGKDDRILDHLLNQLIDGQLVCKTGSLYTLTELGANQVKRFMREGFDGMLLAAADSAASQRFCRQVYGRDLCQFNTMSQTQLDKLLQVMDLSAADHLLDLGCGLGLVTEYIADITGARVTGIDFAPGAIDRARERTREKGARITYQTMDMDHLRFPSGRFTGVIAIDSLHFVKDLKRTIQSAKDCLQTNGQMGIFYAMMRSPEERFDVLQPDQTHLARVLRDCDLHFHAWDFTLDELALWERILCVAEELRPVYDAEGTRFLYETSVSEAITNSEAIRTGRRRRYLYHIKP